MYNIALRRLPVHLLAMTDVTTRSSRKMLSIAREIGMARGLEGIRARPVALAAGFSPSQVNYHFGGRDALLTAVHHVVREEQFSALSQMLESVSRMPLHLRSIPGFMASALAQLAHDARARTLLLLELDLNAAKSGPLSSEMKEQEFWDCFDRVFSLAAGVAWKWKALFDGALWCAVLDKDPISNAAFLSRLTFRFASRLNGLDDLPIPDEVRGDNHQRERDADVTGRHPRAAKIIDAAVRLLAKGEKIGHRAIAAEANVPLAATTYFFASKTDILAEAYRLIYDRLVMQAPMTMGLSGEPVRLDGATRENQFLMARLILASVRDDSLQPLAEHIRNSRGRSSTEALRKLGAVRADRLDGLLLALCHNGLNKLALHFPPAERPLLFSEKSKELISSLFPEIC